MNVDIYDHDIKVGTISLPPGKVSTQYIKANWSTIMSGPLLKMCAGPNRPFDDEDKVLGLSSHADFIKWLQDVKNWKRGAKRKLPLDEYEYWGMPPHSGQDFIHRMYVTDEFQDGMDINFISAPKDAFLMSIHLHSD